MSFITPFWLLLLLPWTAVAALLLWGKRRQVSVPFVELWRDEVAPMRRRSTRLPPVYVMWVMLAAMLAVIAAGGPALRSSDGTGATSILVDRGVTMTSKRLSQVIQDARDLTRHAKIVRIIPIPGDAIESTHSDWPTVAAALPPTALNSRARVEVAVHQRLASDDDWIILLSDQRPPIEDRRLIQVSPPDALSNVGFTRIAAANGQVMAGIRNQSDQTRATLTINQQPSVEIELPPRNEQRDYFFSLQSTNDPVHVELNVDDDLSADNEAWLVRQGAWPRIEARMPLPAEMTRMIDVYAEHRPAGQDNRAIIAPEIADLGDSPGVVFDVAAPAIEGPVTVASHPITSNVNFGRTISAIAPPAIDGWTPLVFDSRHVYVAVRRQPARQVRVNFDMSEFSRQADFVVFWTNVFDFFATGNGEFTAEPVRQLGAEWKPIQDNPGQVWPGLYRRSDGMLRALNALDVRVDPQVRQKPVDLTISGATIGSRDVSPWTLLGALFGLLAAVFVWPRRRRTIFTPTPKRI